MAFYDHNASEAFVQLAVTTPLNGRDWLKPIDRMICS
jgi:hypothetical protein